MSRLAYENFYSVNDTVSLDIPIRFLGVDYQASAPIKCEFFICPNNKMKGAFDAHEHFKTIMSQVRADHLAVPKPPTTKKE